MNFGPDGGSDFGALLIGQVWEAGENLTQVGVGIELPAAAAFDDGVDDGAALAGSGFADEEPVFLSDCRWPDGILDQIIIDLDAAVAQIDLQRAPLAQGVLHRLAEQALWQVESARFEKE